MTARGEAPRRWNLVAGCSLLIWAAPLLCSSNRAQAEDVVILAGGKDNRGRTRVTGEILEFTGESLRLRRSGDREESYSAQRVIRFETQWPEGYQRGRACFEKGEWEEALAAFRAASKAESREWVRRRLLARAAECFRESGQLERAGEVFLTLYRSDPSTRDFGVIPLQWETASPTSTQEAQAGAWLADNETPPAQLIGASWLMSQGQRGAALEVLQRLTTNRDSRIALLAEAQRWRARLAVAKTEDVDEWQRQIERLPEGLAAGPYFVVGEAWARLDQPQAAAWAYLRIPILFPEQRRLSTAALAAAARQLEKIGQTEEAARLRAEAESLGGGPRPATPP